MMPCLSGQARAHQLELEPPPPELPPPEEEELELLDEEDELRDDRYSELEYHAGVYSNSPGNFSFM